MKRWGTIALMGVLTVLAACGRAEREPVLPEPDSIAAWFGDETETRMNGNVLEIHGKVDPEFLRRGGSLWARSSPYFFLFNVKVRETLESYPDLAAVRAITYDSSGKELARATVKARELNEYEWRDALALASLAQREGTQSPRHIAALVRFGEEKIEYEYQDD